ncbi:hypothetical protein F3B47_20760 [Bacteroides fragilis]|uniref:Uncharacterized protein n=1 Tax=Bacteroides fragilis TaxID=817 RepID=A0A5C6KVY7_BACFG|nr:hypothetical protein F3B36_21315 [Bacteroides fragilis]KAA4756791.1 hypothetical protein F3B47_20760 [Bacteroides fragilis]KAA4757961.1 hypothetical protein F3B24_20840 [Bacteroides fragilis]KAA4759632.1 hypothetical protein F3B25_20005 [Bacteroides fragilis]KAA4779054.1 hypothetical protein F3B40_05285 [Bacteroides fragilis]
MAIIFFSISPTLPVFFVLLQLVGKLCTSGIREQIKRKNNI